MKFINLLKKELAELINIQMIGTLLIIVAMFALMGTVTSDAIDEAVESAKTVKVNIDDRDDSELTADILEKLKNDYNAKITLIDSEGDDYAAILSKNNIKSLIIIPEGFSDAFEKGETPEVISVSRMRSASTMSTITEANTGGLDAISRVIYDLVTEEAGLSKSELARMEKPVSISENTVIGDKSAEVSASSVLSKVSTQNMFLPIIVFLLIMLTSQTLITAISNEKIDKTLETLLSAPVSRGAVIGSKMLAASLAALINAAVCMFSFSKFFAGAMENEAVSGAVSSVMSTDDALSKLGLTLNAADYILVGIQLFVTIMICLAISIILGALVNDTKSAQTIILPIILLAMVPYVISMLTDVNELPTMLRWIMYAIPFTHTFAAVPNLMFGNMTLFWGGLIYEAVFLAVCLFFALRLFNSDKILTISLNFGQRSKFKKKAGQSEDE